MFSFFISGSRFESATSCVLMSRDMFGDVCVNSCIPSFVTVLGCSVFEVVISCDVKHEEGSCVNSCELYICT